MSKFIIIGIDPGSSTLGYAIVEYSLGSVSLRSSGVIIFKKHDTLQKKLLYVFDYFKLIVLDYVRLNVPLYFSVERPFLHKNPLSYLVLVSFFSIFLLLSEMSGHDCIVMSPSQVKKIISGFGNCSKEHLFLLLQDQVSLPLEVSSLDESDAIAIAFAGTYALLQGK